VLLMPASRSPSKQLEPDPGPGHRLAMCRLAAAENAGQGDAGLGVCALEIERGGPSYTVDALRALLATHPDTKLTLIVGSDVARTLPAWREPGELLALAELAVAVRAGAKLEEPLEVRETLAALLSGGRAPNDRLRFLSMPAIDISSSLVRERVRRGVAVDALVGPTVASYLAAHRLYRVAASQARSAS
jgi:nicotinate-nucleotide adenylyltransferase